MNKQSVQELYAPASRCFGCGPSNPEGLQIASHREGEELVARFTTQPHHLAFPGMVNGGILGSLLDCHANWAAAVSLMELRGLESPVYRYCRIYRADETPHTPWGRACDSSTNRSVRRSQSLGRRRGLGRRKK